jgi:predicted Zn-dependent protease
MAEFKRRQDLMKEELADQAGLDPLADRQKVGAIKAYQDFLDIEEESL